MPCEVSNGASLDEYSLDDSWTKTESSNTRGSLDAIAELNTGFDTGYADDLLNPGLEFCHPPAPSSPYGAALPGSSGLHQMLSPNSMSYNGHGSDFSDQRPNSPYCQSIEGNPVPILQLSEFRNLHRRSVSEPPGAPPMQQNPPLVMTFHRENRYLGRPTQRTPVPHKSLAKNKRSRCQPYPQGPQERSLYLRPGHRRAQTQPIQGAPTSAPSHLDQSNYIPQSAMQEPCALSSRLCTPALVDSALSTMPSVPRPRQHQTLDIPGSVLSIPLSVGELRGMIFDAIQEAMGTVVEGKRETRTRKGEEGQAGEAVTLGGADAGVVD